MTTDVVTAVTAAVTAGAYVIDAAPSQIRFTATHVLGLGRVVGTCMVRDGTITVAPDPAGCAVIVWMDAASLATGNARRDKSIQSERFLHAQDYPDMLFVAG